MVGVGEPFVGVGWVGGGGFWLDLENRVRKREDPRAGCTDVSSWEGRQDLSLLVLTVI